MLAKGKLDAAMATAGLPMYIDHLHVCLHVYLHMNM